jgi:hypothetical protein
MRFPLAARARRLAALAPAVVASWSVLVGLPLAPQEGRPGHLETTVVPLTGPAARSDGRTSSTSATATDGWSSSVEVDDGTQMVALTWDDATAPTAALAVRSRGADGRWSDWVHVDADEQADEGPDAATGETGNGRAGVGPIWLGRDGAEQVQVRVDDGAFPDLTLQAMRWIDPVGPAGDPAGAEPDGPGIIGRSAWAPGGWRGDNAGCPASPPASDRLAFAVVHHTVNANDYTQSQVAGILAGIYRYETDGLGWCDMAYNFIIDRFGRTWQGRSGDLGLPIIGGHSKGFNTDSVGVAFLGQFQPGASPPASSPTEEARTALYELLAWKFSIHGLDPRSEVTVRSLGSTKYPEGQSVRIPRITGHRAISLTSCPGDNLQRHLPTTRAAVDFLEAVSATPERWAPFANPREHARRQYLDGLGREPTNTEAAWWADRMQRGGASPADLTRDLLQSSEASLRTWSIPRLYLAYFLRPPEHDGLRFWWNRYHAGTSSLGAISQAFASSSEFTNRYGDLGDEAFVRRVYQNVLQREPDASGLAFWTGQLDRGVRSRGGVMTGFSESGEFVRNTFARVGAIVVHEALLGRAPTASEYTTWTQRIVESGSLGPRVSQILGSNEYRRRIQSLG